MFALKMFRGLQEPALEKEPPADSDPTSDSASPADSPPDPIRPHSIPAVERIWLRGREPAPSRIPTPAEDAQRLLRWVGESGYAGKAVLAEDMQKIYPVLCKEVLNRDPYVWQLVAEPLRRLTGGRKQYTRVRLTPGGRKEHRRRVYLIPN